MRFFSLEPKILFGQTDSQKPECEKESKQEVDIKDLSFIYNFYLKHFS